MADNNNNDDNLDIFLTLLESKLKAPFSSTEIPKTIKTLRNEKPVEYLEKVSKVLRRAEKVTQLRFLVGILGIIVDEKSSSSSSVLFEANKKDGSNKDTGQEDEAAAIESILKKICQNAQEAPAYEEWVRVIAGIVEKALILHWGSRKDDDDDDHNNNVHNEDEKEADQVMDKTCKEILDRVRTVLKNTARIDEDTEYRLEQADADPTFAPFRYALVSPQLLEQVIPDIQTNHHFTVNKSADILNIDAKLELEKAKEEAEHQKTGQLAKSGNNNNNNNSATNKKGTEPTEVLFPGFRSTKASTASSTTATTASKQQQPQQQRPKSSMFMPSKRPVSAVAGAGRGGIGTAAAGRGRLMGLKPAPSTGLHQRKAGAAQALLQRNRARMLNRAGSSSVKEPRSKMKMIDVTEVEGLQKKEETASTPAEKSAMSAKLGQKRNRSETVTTTDRQDKRIKATTTNNNDRKPPPASDGTTATSPSNDNNSTSPLHHHAGALANAALLAYQQSRSVPTNLPRPSSILQPSQSTGSACSNGGGTTTKQQDWRSLLKEHSNRLSEDDRNRIRHFFVDHVNPTPEQALYKMKLHEERTTDPKTGEPVKETYYLELDYSNFTSRQSKKVKRYGNAG